MARLHARWRVPLVTVTAGAGFGKTTLLAEAMAENRLAPEGRDVWLGCGPGDADAATLVAGLLAALGRPPAAGRRPTAEEVVDAVWAESPHEVALLLDDVHTIEPASDGAAALAELLARLPANGHLVLAGRRVPPAATARLEAHGRTERIGEGELRLDAAELGELAARAGLADDGLDATAGWPALVALATSGQVPSTRFALEEVIEPLGPATRQAFAALVLIGDGDRAMVRAAAGTGAADLEAIAQLPLVDEDAGVLRPHQLWESTVAELLSADEAREVRRRAATAHRERGEHARAYELLVAAGLWEHARVALLDACNDQVSPPRPEQLRRWSAGLPPEADDAVRAYLEALLLRFERPWHPRTLARFADARSGFAARGEIAEEMRAAVRSSYTAWEQEDAARLDELSERVVALGLDDDPLLGAAATMGRAAAADVRGDAAAVLRLLGEVDAAGVEPRLAFFLPRFTVDALLTVGRADEAVEPADRAAALARPLRPAGGTWAARLRSDLVRWFLGDAPVADDDGPDAFRDPGADVQRDERVESVAWAAIRAAHRGELDRARRSVDALHAILPPQHRSRRVRGLLALVEATVAVAAGDEPGARVALAGLDPERVEPGTSWRAVLWQPGVAATLEPALAEALERCGPGPSQACVLAAAAALRGARRGEPVDTAALTLLGRPAALLAALPLPLAVELAVVAAAAGDDRADAVVVHAVEVSPTGVRAALRRAQEHPLDSAGGSARAILRSLPLPPEAPLRLDVLGPARLWRGDREVDEADWRREKVRLLLLLLVARGEVRREQVAALLWPDLDGDRAASNLRLTLHYLNGVLEPGRAKGEPPYVVRQDGGTLRLAGPEGIEVDLAAFEAELDAAAGAEADGNHRVALGHLRRAVGRWRGDPLADAAYAEWAVPERERLRARFVAAGVRAAELLVADGQPEEAIRTATRVLSTEPWCEPAYRVQAVAHLASGNRAAALRSLERCHAVLDELGAEPEEATTMVGRRVRRGG